MVTDAASGREPIARPGIPWTLPARAARAAFQPGRLVLAALGLLLLSAGWDVLDRLWPATADVTFEVLARATDAERLSGPGQGLATTDGLRAAAWRLAAPFRILARPLRVLLTPGTDARGSLHALGALLWVVVVWGIFGGAIARTALLDLARPGSSGPIKALRFAIGLAVPLLATPLYPLLAIGFCALACAGFGLLYWIPFGIGKFLVAALFVIPLALALVAVILTIVLVAGWPLMHASVAAEAEDMLDAMSRTFGYLNQRGGKVIACAVLCALIGIPALLVATILAAAVPQAAIRGVSLLAPTVRQTADAYLAVWAAAVEWLVQGWVYSYTWTAAAMLYLVLRSDVDGTPVSQVANPAAAAPTPPAAS